MPYSCSAIREVLKPLDRRMLRRAVEAHNGNRGVGEGRNAWTCQRHAKTLIIAQLAGLDSLRKIEPALAARPTALYHLDLRPAKRSTLSDALHDRPAAVLRELCDGLIGCAGRQLRQEGKDLIRLLDASPVPLRDLRFAWAEADARVRGLKLHLLYDPDAAVPVHFEVTSARVSDLTPAREIVFQAGATYVFDKGYTNYALWHSIDQAKALFVTRLKSNAVRQTLEDRPLPEKTRVLADRLVHIGNKKYHGRRVTNPIYHTKLREVIVPREDDKPPLSLVTNDLERSADEIAALYKRRWDIELMFKWIKQNLNIKAFLGRSKNAVLSQIYAALLAFLLLRLFQTGVARSAKLTARNLLAAIRVALFDPLDLTLHARPPPKNTPATSQLAFHLA